MEKIINALERLDKQEFKYLLKRTEEYKKKLQSAVNKALSKTAKVRKDDDWELERIIKSLQEELISLGEIHIPIAVRLGYGSQPMDDRFKMKVEELIAQNSKYLRSNYIPEFRRYVKTGHKDLDEDDEEEDDTLRDNTDTAKLGLLAGIALYAGAFWSAIWNGLGLAVDKFKQALMGEHPREPVREPIIRIRRYLDEGAMHCESCPPKEGLYDSWEEMLQECGGLPGDGSDDCMSNCRCSLETEIE